MANYPELTDDQWDELLERLTRHASCKLARLTWRGVRRGPAPGGVEASDLAATAIVQVIQGERAWDRSIQPDFQKFLKGVVDSRISGLVLSLENRKTSRLGRLEPGDEGSAAYDLAGTEREASDLVSSREEQETFRAAVIGALEGDEQALLVFECLEGDMTKPAEIAEYLDLSVDEIYNVKKRLQRKLAGLQPKGKGGIRG